MSGIVALFHDDRHWRDLTTFTWNIKTMSGKDAVKEMLDMQLSTIVPKGFVHDTSRPSGDEHGVMSAWWEFDTKVAQGEAHIRIRDGKIWTLFTAAAALRDHPDPVGPNRPFGAIHGTGADQRTWKERRNMEAAELGYSKQPYLRFIGGGQGGIALGARLRQHGVPALIVETNPWAGDSWRNRYKSLCLHDPVWSDHLPYLKFPDNWPVFPPRIRLAIGWRYMQR